MRVPIEDWQVDLAIAKMRKGLHLRTAATELGLSYSALFKAVQKILGVSLVEWKRRGRASGEIVGDPPPRNYSAEQRLRRNKAVEAVRNGASYTMAGRAANVTGACVRLWCIADGEAWRTRRAAYQQQPWTAEEEEILRAAWMNGFPVSEIRRQLNRNQNQILGKIYRLGLSRSRASTADSCYRASANSFMTHAARAKQS
jgi:hypothetical protein